MEPLNYTLVCWVTILTNTKNFQMIETIGQTSNTILLIHFLIHMPIKNGLKRKWRISWHTTHTATRKWWRTSKRKKRIKNLNSKQKVIQTSSIIISNKAGNNLYKLIKRNKTNIPIKNINLTKPVYNNLVIYE